jgi:hypothetical protein
MRLRLCALVIAGTIGASCELPAAPGSAGSPPSSDLALVPAPGPYKLVIDISDSCGIPAPTNSRSYDVEVGELSRTGWASVKNTGTGLEGDVNTSGRFAWNDAVQDCDYPDAGNPPLYVCGDGHVSLTETGFKGEIEGTVYPNLQPASFCDGRHRVTLTRR